MQRNNKPTQKELKLRVKELIPKHGKQVMKQIKRFIKPFVKAKTNFNSRYSQEEYFYGLLFTALKQYSAEGSSKVLNLSIQSPSPDQMLRVFRLDDKTLSDAQDCMLDSMFATAKRFGAFEQATDVAIDFFDIPYYGDTNSLNVVGTKHKAGTSYAHSFACCDAVIKGERFCLANLPRTMQTEDAELARKLLLAALERVLVRIAMLDREFFQVAVIKLLYGFGVHFIIPATDTPEIKRLKRENRNNLPCTVDYTMRSKDDEVTMKLVLIERTNKRGKKEAHGFITDLHWQPIEVAEQYRNRFGTETNNRKRNEFRAMTTSRSYKLRRLYYMLSVALHNIWVLVNLMIAYLIYQRPTVPLIETYMMKELVEDEIKSELKP